MPIMYLGDKHGEEIIEMPKFRGRAPKFLKLSKII